MSSTLATRSSQCAMMGVVVILLTQSPKGHQEGRPGPDLVLPPCDQNLSPITYALGWIHLHNRALALSSERVRLISSTRLNWELAFTLQLLIQQYLFRNINIF